MKTDLARGEQSPAYEAFFKTDDILPYVIGVFASIAAGPPIQVPAGSRGGPFLAYPSFICLSDDLPAQFKNGIAQGCNKHAAIGRWEDMIVICDSWFEWVSVLIFML